MEHVYNGKTLCDLQNAKEKFIVLNENDWKLDVESKPKLRTYVKFKRNLLLEDYITHYTSKRCRSLVAQFRLGILPIHIETGRFTKTPLNERICKICDLNEIEDEYHFLLSCPKYITPRETLYNSSRKLIPNIKELNTQEKFINIVQLCPKYLANYLVTSLEIRNSILYVSK